MNSLIDNSAVIVFKYCNYHWEHTVVLQNSRTLEHQNKGVNKLITKFYLYRQGSDYVKSVDHNEVNSK